MYTYVTGGYENMRYAYRFLEKATWSVWMKGKTRPYVAFLYHTPKFSHITKIASKKAP